ncbi:MAG: type III secretion system chaperone [Mailhella sp.]|nr:type III secretion system chaperone [Mailhella sp.]
MNAEELIRELGRSLGIALELSPQGTCRVDLDGDMVDFEKSGEKLYVMADLGSSLNREDAHASLLTANCLGAQTGGATLGIDPGRAMFTLHLLVNEVPYSVFEADLARFIRAMRWWKEWLALPPLPEGRKVPSTASAEMSFDPFAAHTLRV